MADSKQSAWKAKRVGTLNKFYTRPEIGALLIEELGELEPRSIVDLGAGEGSLSLAVGSRWPAARLVTVDIDDACVASLHGRLSGAGVKTHEHHKYDVLDTALPRILGEQQFDLAVCNPPFYRPGWQRSFADILQTADFANACPNVADVSAEILFFAQNLRLVRSDGTIVLIVPDRLATGLPAVAFRRALLQQHTLRTVVQLPAYSFLDTEAYCFILIIEKRPPQPHAQIKLIQLAEDGSVSEPVAISREAAEARLDYSYHALAQARPLEAVTLRQLGAEIHRGSLGSVERKTLDGFVFHTGDFPTASTKVTFNSAHLNSGGKTLVVAESGDILMARIDRHLHEKIALVAGGTAAITDCVYRIRLPEQHRQRAFAALSSKHGRALIRAATKGVGARLIGKGELLDLPLPLEATLASNTV